MKNLIYILLLGISLCSCSSDDGTVTINNPEVENPSIIGNWNWTFTGGGLSGAEHVTPVDIGKTIQLNLNEDSTYSILENGALISNGKYTLTLAHSIYSVDMENFISYSKFFEVDWRVNLSGVINAPDVSRLVISDNLYDGFESHFEKID